MRTVALACAVLACACGGGSSKPAATSTRAPSNVATAGASSAASSVTLDGYRAVDVLPQLNFARMLGLQVIPGDDTHALLLTKDGIVRRVSMVDDSEPTSSFLDIRDRMINNPAQEQGLLGLAYAPDFATSGRFYLYYSAGDPRRSVISRFEVAPRAGTAAPVGDPASERVMLEIDEPYPNHQGGSLAFGPDGMLYIGVGDGGSEHDPQGNGQNTDTLLAKILRIDVSGDDARVPSDNPFASGGGRGEIWTYGMRNPWRINFDLATGRLWAGDVGQDHWEEVDLIAKGANYGWSVVEGNNHCHNPASGCDPESFATPRAEYSHDDGCSITGGFVYRGKAMLELTGWYVYSDYCSGNVWAFDTASDAPPVLLADTKLNVTSFGQDRDGELYLVTFNNKIAKLERR